MSVGVIEIDGPGKMKYNLGIPNGANSSERGEGTEERIEEGSSVLSQGSNFGRCLERDKSIPQDYVRPN
jgi:hypothetical protein